MSSASHWSQTLLRTSDGKDNISLLGLSTIHGGNPHIGRRFGRRIAKEMVKKGIGTLATLRRTPPQLEQHEIHRNSSACGVHLPPRQLPTNVVHYQSERCYPGGMGPPTSRMRSATVLML
ncbi:hypothetical protein MJO28_014280 [Puccinia striiformis f. sp. tritici]|uniref:Uncharacterized protein n=2 Tax=Puccinia striiformis TaxID=27350 RepID=A0A2S4V471_9BASI|nr:hypothetical protein MJO28_014280 [Puccinia striiformis f. sp. tritici]POW04270.1 hypothetical protein PSHT_11320 [Puccinia striiformis]